MVGTVPNKIQNKTGTSGTIFGNLLIPSYVYVYCLIDFNSLLYSFLVILCCVLGGKSAILTALCIAFGCRAKSTDRATTLKEFIKTGCRFV